MKSFTHFLDDCLPDVEEILPWDLINWMEEGRDLLLVDVREPYEFAAMHIANSINVPRGILESAAEYQYEETEPELVEARDRIVIVVCRSGRRSLLAAKTLKLMGYKAPYSLKSGLRGWNDYEQSLFIADKKVDIDEADEYFTVKITKAQMGPE